ncbi:hypothetical protein AAMO2058_001457800 [Amorphochlora amoebiformis]
MASKTGDPYWLVAFPQEYKGPSRVGLQRLMDKVKGYARVVKFEIPGNLKIGTLDSLMSLTESLGKVDSLIAMSLGKVLKTLEDIQGKESELGVIAYRSVTSFKWQYNKFMVSCSLHKITDGIENSVRGQEGDIKKMMNTYNEVSQTLDSINRTDNGTLLVRPLNPILKNVNVYPSPSLEIIFVVVSSKKKSEFLATYETMEESYKKRRARKEEENTQMARDQRRRDLSDAIPEILKSSKDEKKRSEMLQGGAVYKHIANVMRKAKDMIAQGQILSDGKRGRDENFDQKAAEAKAKEALEDDLAKLTDILSDAIEEKLKPYDHQAPNNSGARAAVVDVVLTAEEFDIQGKHIDNCRKMVTVEYGKAKKEIERKLAEMKRSEKKKLPDPPYIVPGSANLLDEDDEYCLFKMMIMKKFKDEVLKICREKRITVRAYKYDPDGELNHTNKKNTLAATQKKLRNRVINKCKVSYPDIFQQWMHIKAVRCFAESVLRFGLPKKTEDFKAIFPNHIQAALVQPFPGRDQRVRQIMKKLYSGLASAEVTAELDASETDYSGLGANFYPYVYLQIDLNHAL